MSSIGDVLTRLEATIEARKGESPDSSYTASLLSKGAERCAKKFGEEAVEAALAGATGKKDELAAEAADVLYHLGVLLAANGLRFADVAAVLAAREGVSGHDEKASRGK
ncbi:phosphoribosyl-ATP diphosphatase [Parvularcula marina]|uniref:phosphoribosyl-ATP diphosphatase n=1 Tax=Parvularcula marina TaxID=2292771 RepID=UPI0035116265